MFAWFVGTAVLAVWYVFGDPAFDYRLLVVGSVLAELDGLAGGARVMHSVAFSVVVLFGVMAVTRRSTARRRLLLGLPIGTFLHLVFDGAWANTTVFWWPFGGWSFHDAALPPVARGWWSVVLEAIGVVMVIAIWRRAGLSDAGTRRHALRTGQLRLAG
ncbi:hypothetical protein BH24ACT5_BH24ACT5_00180 [soil metagenome]